MSDRHSYSHHSADPILGIRLGVNAVAIAEGKTSLCGYLPPRGATMKLAAELAVLQYQKAPRNAAPTLRVENIKAALIATGGKPADRRSIETEDLRTMLSVDAETEAQRNKIARTRYAETKAMREAAAEAKRAERKAKRDAAKAKKEAANA